MRTVYRRDADNWGPDGPQITSTENLASIRRVLEDYGPIIVEHRHYRGSSAPDRYLFDDFDDFQGWLATTFAGDSVWVWDYSVICRDDNALAHGKCPDERGEVPQGGAY